MNTTMQANMKFWWIVFTVSNNLLLKLTYASSWTTCILDLLLLFLRVPDWSAPFSCQWPHSSGSSKIYWSQSAFVSYIAELSFWQKRCCRQVFRMSGGGPVIGLAFGVALSFCLTFMQERLISQCLLTVAAAYASYIVSDSQCDSSGVLSVVSLGRPLNYERTTHGWLYQSCQAALWEFECIELHSHNMTVVFPVLLLPLLYFILVSYSWAHLK